MKYLTLLLTALLLAMPVEAQKNSPRSKLRKMMKAAKSDPESLVEAAKFASENGFLKERGKLIKKILKADPGNEWANTAMGRVKFKGKWYEKKAYDQAVAKELEAKYKAEGRTLVDGVWVKENHVADAKRGVFHHDGQRVTKYDKQQLMLGKIRHPRTGTFIAKADLEKANKGEFPLGGGLWGSLEKANRFHKSKNRPWVIRTKYLDLRFNEPLESVDTGENNLVALMDAATAKVLKIFGSTAPPPDRRPVVRLVASKDAYAAMGKQLIDDDFAHDVFYAPKSKVGSGRKDGITFVNISDKTWRPFLVRHAAAYAVSLACAGDQAAKVPKWFHRGVGGYVERFNKPGDAKHFAKQQKDKRGGVRRLGELFGNFQVSSMIEQDEMRSNLVSAGAVIAFLLEGGDQLSTDALTAVTKAYETGGNVAGAIKKMETRLTKRETQFREWFDKLTQ